MFALLLLLLSLSSLALALRDSTTKTIINQQQLASLRRDALYKCELSYLQMDTSLIKFSVEHLIVGGQVADGVKVTLRGDNFVLEEINFNSSIEQLHRSTKLDPKLPFLFFINGFNTLNECKCSLYFVLLFRTVHTCTIN